MIQISCLYCTFKEKNLDELDTHAHLAWRMRPQGLFDVQKILSQH